MCSQLIDATNKWFLWPSSTDKPSYDRLWVFITLVALLGETDRSGEFSKNVHYYFTYLLHGCNPVTAERNLSAFHDKVTEDPIFTDDLLRQFSRLLNFDGPPEIGARFAVYSKFSEVANEIGSVLITDTIGEQRTLLLLSIALCTYLTNQQPTDLVAVQACLNLYNQHLRITSGTAQVEYSNEIGLKFTPWLKTNMNRLFVMDRSPTEVVMSRIGYMAWFASLIKAHRVLRAFRSDEEVYGPYIRNLLKGEVDKLFKYIGTFPLIAVEVDETPICSKFFNVLGVKPKKKLNGK